jgi:hypothetical protein
MSDAGMVRLPRQDTVQDRRRLFLIGISFIGRRGSCDQAKGVKNGRFVIFRVARRKPLHSVTPCSGPLVMGHFIGVFIKLFDCGDVVAFTLRLRSNRLGFFNRSDPLPQIGRRGRKRYGVIKAHSDAPVSHRAIRIEADYLRECLFGFVVPERVQKGDTVFEGLLCLGSTGDGKMYMPEIVLMILGNYGTGRLRGD